MVIKSAVAFFFLFFLHGTSIGNGQQGISYNGRGYEQLCVSLSVGELLIACVMLVRRVVRWAVKYFK
jgi:hypothetical protein